MTAGGRAEHTALHTLCQHGRCALLSGLSRRAGWIGKVVDVLPGAPERHC